MRLEDRGTKGLLSAFTVKEIQSYITMTRWLGRFDKTVDDVEEYMDQRLEKIKRNAKRNMKRGRIMKVIAPKCEKCGSALVPSKVEKNERGWKSRWACSKNWYSKDMNEWCDYELLSTKTIREILNEGVQYEIRRGIEEGTKVEQEQPSK